MADLLLVNPAWIRGGRNIWKTIAGVTPPIGLASLAAFARQAGHRVELLDASALDLDRDGIRARLRGKTYTHLGLTATTTIVNRARETAALLRELYPTAPIILGGVHATVRPDEMLADPNLDYVIRGEGERPLAELLAGDPPAGIAGLSWRDGAAVRHNPDRAPIPDLDALPRPAYDLLPLGRYFPSRGSYRRLPALGMVVSRGCPSQCTFCCGHLLGRKVRFRSAGLIYDEVRYLMREHGIREISFYDDNLTVNPAIVTEFCEQLARDRVDLTWSCFSRIEFVTPDLLRLMARTGCHQVMFGIESADPRILANLKKPLDLARAETAVRAAQAAGIEARCTFMLGSPGETAATMQTTIDYALRLDPDFALFNITTPFPGTELFRWADERGFLLTKNWDDYDLSRPLLKLPTVDGKTIVDYYRRAFRAFYFRPRLIWRQLKRLRRPAELVAAIKTGWGLLGLVCGRGNGTSGSDGGTGPSVGSGRK